MKIYTELMCILPQDPLNEMDDDIEIIKISIQKIELLSAISYRMNRHYIGQLRKDTQS